MPNTLQRKGQHPTAQNHPAQTVLKLRNPDLEDDHIFLVTGAYIYMGAEGCTVKSGSLRKDKGRLSLLTLCTS